MSEQSFHEFEHTAWEDSTVCNNYHSHLSGITIQAIEALLDAAVVGPQRQVLDVCTGAGYAAGKAAERGAHVTGVDFSQMQIELARKNYPNVVFKQGEGDALPFPDSSFDAVINNFGMCHFADPVAAIDEAWRVLRPGGHFAFTVWDRPDKVIGFGAIYSALQTHGSLAVDLPAGPDFFLFSDPAECEKTLMAAGFHAARVSHVQQLWQLRSPDDVFDIILKSTVRAAATLKEQSDEALQAVRSAVSEIIRSYQVDDSYDVPMPAVLAVATKPVA